MGSLLTFWLRQTMSPELGGTAPEIKFTVVDLPDPLGPINPTISLEFTSKLKFLTACTPPKFLLT
jgi:hypothetical protein